MSLSALHIIKPERSWASTQHHAWNEAYGEGLYSCNKWEDSSMTCLCSSCQCLVIWLELQLVQLSWTEYSKAYLASLIARIQRS